MGLERVLQPIKIGGVEIPNRVVSTAHSTYAGPSYSEQSIAYHVERAIGGCGLTILQASSVHPSSLLGKALYDDAAIPSIVPSSMPVGRMACASFSNYGTAAISILAARGHPGPFQTARDIPV
jgi:hypothetical protein